MPHPDHDPLLGTTVAGRYRVQRVIGEGGMGRVYLARHDAIDKDIALKVLHEEYSFRADVVMRFQQEAKSASRIKHPNVIDVYDFGQLPDGRFYLAAEFLEGHDLAAEVARRGRPTVERAIEILLILCDALETAHERGVVHRDMKPENVFLEGGEVKIVDFGIAKLREMREEYVGGSMPVIEISSNQRITRYGTVCGTPEYMAPEQAAGREVDGRADVYACGVILFELLTGRVPFQGNTVIETLTMHLTQEAPRPSDVKGNLGLSHDLEAVVARALAKQPEDRFASMSALAEALVRTPEGRLLSHRLRRRPASEAPIPLVAGTDRPMAETVPEMPAKPSRAPLAFALVAGVLLVGGAGAWVATRKPPGPAPAAPATGTTPQVVAASDAPSVGGVTAPPPGASAQPAQVKLKVTSEPPGALVKRQGFQVCDATPCEITVKPGEALELSAEKGELRGLAKILATADQTVAIRLVKLGPLPAAPPTTTAPATKTTAGDPPPKPKMCEVMVGDLKVLQPCK